MSYPSSIPSYAGFTSGHTLAQDTHAAQHNSEQTDIIGLATKLGTGSATASNNTVLRGNGAGTSTWAQLNLTTDVTGTLPISLGGTGATSASTALAALGGTTLAAVYPIGSVYIETTGTNPATTFGFGTWVAFAAGQTIIGVGTSDQTFTAATTGGESNHKLTIAEMPAHTHNSNDAAQKNESSGATANAVWKNTTTTATSSTGGDGAHNNLPPYIVVYMWKRTA